MGWEHDRSKKATSFGASKQPVIELAELRLSAEELRAAYDDAVAEREATSDPGPVNPGFLRLHVEKRRRPAPARAKRAEDWERDDSAAVRKGSELGLYMRAHERIETYRERIRVELRDRQHRNGARP